MKRYLMRLLGVTLNAAAHRYSGMYVVSYDAGWHRPDGTYDGGLLECTPDVAEAGRFTLEEFRALVLSSPECLEHRLRPDGKPNRPLTAFDVEGIPVED